MSTVLRITSLACLAAALAVPAPTLAQYTASSRFPTPLRAPATSPPEGVQGVPADAESSSGPAIFDAELWVHPSEPQYSTIIATDRQYGLRVYDVEGNQIQGFRFEGLRNLEITYKLRIGGEYRDLVSFSSPEGRRIGFLSVDPDTGKLRPVGLLHTGDLRPKGLCSYRTDKGIAYFFLVAPDGKIIQFRLIGDQYGRVRGRPVRSLEAAGPAESCVVDDYTGYLYVAVTKQGIQKFKVGSTGPSDRWVDYTSPRGNLEDVEGLALYKGGGSSGYLLASSKGNSTICVYDRATGSYVTQFTITSSGPVDGAESTIGLGVTNVAIGGLFPDGMLVAQDSYNGPSGDTNLKLVDWGKIATSTSPSLLIDRYFNPRPGVSSPPGPGAPGGPGSGPGGPPSNPGSPGGPSNSPPGGPEEAPGSPGPGTPAISVTPYGN